MTGEIVAAGIFIACLAAIFYSGGIATLIGDPPNILIASAAGLTFNDFLVNSLPLIALVWLAVLGLLLFMFRRELAVRPSNTEAVASSPRMREAAGTHHWLGRYPGERLSH